MTISSSSSDRVAAPVELAPLFLSPARLLLHLFFHFVLVMCITGMPGSRKMNHGPWLLPSSSLVEKDKNTPHDFLFMAAEAADTLTYTGSTLIFTPNFQYFEEMMPTLTNAPTTSFSYFQDWTDVVRLKLTKPPPPLRGTDSDQHLQRIKDYCLPSSTRGVFSSFSAKNTPHPEKGDAFLEKEECDAEKGWYYPNITSSSSASRRHDDENDDDDNIFRNMTCVVIDGFRCGGGGKDKTEGGGAPFCPSSIIIQHDDLLLPPVTSYEDVQVEEISITSSSSSSSWTKIIRYSYFPLVVIVKNIWSNATKYTTSFLQNNGGMKIEVQLPMENLDLSNAIMSQNQKNQLIVVHKNGSSQVLKRIGYPALSFVEIDNNVLLMGDSSFTIVSNSKMRLSSVIGLVSVVKNTTVARVAITSPSGNVQASVIRIDHLTMSCPYYQSGCIEISAAKKSLNFLFVKISESKITNQNTLHQFPSAIQIAAIQRIENVFFLVENCEIQCESYKESGINPHYDSRAHGIFIGRKDSPLPSVTSTVIFIIGTFIEALGKLSGRAVQVHVNRILVPGPFSIQTWNSTMVVNDKRGPLHACMNIGLEIAKDVLLLATAEAQDAAREVERWLPERAFQKGWNSTLQEFEAPSSIPSDASQIAEEQVILRRIHRHVSLVDLLLLFSLYDDDAAGNFPTPSSARGVEEEGSGIELMLLASLFDNTTLAGLITQLSTGLLGTRLISIWGGNHLESPNHNLFISNKLEMQLALPKILWKEQNVTAFFPFANRIFPRILFPLQNNFTTYHYFIWAQWKADYLLSPVLLLGSTCGGVRVLETQNILNAVIQFRKMRCNNFLHHLASNRMDLTNLNTLNGKVLQGMTAVCALWLQATKNIDNTTIHIQDSFINSDSGTRRGSLSGFRIWSEIGAIRNLSFIIKNSFIRTYSSEYSNGHGVQVISIRAERGLLSNVHISISENSTLFAYNNGNNGVNLHYDGWAQGILLHSLMSWENLVAYRPPVFYGGIRHAHIILQNGSKLIVKGPQYTRGIDFSTPRDNNKKLQVDNFNIGVQILENSTIEMIGTRWEWFQNVWAVFVGLKANYKIFFVLPSEIEDADEMKLVPPLILMKQSHIISSGGGIYLECTLNCSSRPQLFPSSSEKENEEYFLENSNNNQQQKLYYLVDLRRRYHNTFDLGTASYTNLRGFVHIFWKGYERNESEGMVADISSGALNISTHARLQMEVSSIRFLNIDFINQRATDIETAQFLALEVAPLPPTDQNETFFSYVDFLNVTMSNVTAICHNNVNCMSIAMQEKGSTVHVSGVINVHLEDTLISTSINQGEDQNTVIAFAAFLGNVKKMPGFSFLDRQNEFLFFIGRRKDRYMENGEEESSLSRIQFYFLRTTLIANNRHARYRDQGNAVPFFLQYFDNSTTSPFLQEEYRSAPICNIEVHDSFWYFYGAYTQSAIHVFTSTFPIPKADPPGTEDGNLIINSSLTVSGVAKPRLKILFRKTYLHNYNGGGCQRPPRLLRLQALYTPILLEIDRVNMSVRCHKIWPDFGFVFWESWPYLSGNWPEQPISGNTIPAVIVRCFYLSEADSNPPSVLVSSSTNFLSPSRFSIEQISHLEFLDCETCQRHLDCYSGNTLSVSGVAPDACTCVCDPEVIYNFRRRQLQRYGKRVKAVALSDQCDISFLTASVSVSLTESLALENPTATATFLAIRHDEDISSASATPLQLTASLPDNTTPTQDSDWITTSISQENVQGEGINSSRTIDATSQGNSSINESSVLNITSPPPLSSNLSSLRVAPLIPELASTASKLGTGLAVPSSAVVSVSALTGSAAGSSAVDLQCMLVLGMMADCSDPFVIRMSEKSKFLISPLPLWNTSSGAVAGSLLLSVCGAALHFLIVFLCSEVFLSNTKKSNKDKTKTTTTPFEVASAKLRFPSLSFRLFQLLYQGLVLNALMTVAHLATSGDATTAREESISEHPIGANSNGLDWFLSLTALFLCLVTPVSLMSWFLFSGLGEHSKKNKKDGVSRIHFIEYRHVFQNSNKFLKSMILPWGYWTEKKTERNNDDDDDDDESSERKYSEKSEEENNRSEELQEIVASLSSSSSLSKNERATTNDGDEKKGGGKSQEVLPCLTITKRWGFLFNSSRPRIAQTSPGGVQNAEEEKEKADDGDDDGGTFQKGKRSNVSYFTFSIVVFSLPFIKMILVSLLIAWNPKDSILDCGTRFVLLAVLFFSIAILLVFTAPYRNRVHQINSGVLNFCSGMIAIVSHPKFSGSSSSSTSNSPTVISSMNLASTWVPVFMFAASVTSGTALVISLWFQWKQRRWKKLEGDIYWRGEKYIREEKKKKKTHNQRDQEEVDDREKVGTEMKALLSLPLLAGDAENESVMLMKNSEQRSHNPLHQ